MKIYNSLTRKLEDFKPIKEGEVKMYVCGPTVNGPGHLGHASTYIGFDIVRRTFEYLRYKVTMVLNYTDVHDDMIKVANERGISILELAEIYIKQFEKDLEALNILPATFNPRVTEYVDEIINMTETLEKRGFAYETDDGVYFRVSEFKNYGGLSGIKPEEGKSGTRVKTDKYEKENVSDFALWKKVKPGEPSWDSPWGKGRPGWHIECSVMSHDLLGQPFDIHGGGPDLKFPHHENEIAQSEAAYGKKFVNYWMHSGQLNVDGKKMSNSLGNFITIPDALKKFDPMVIRYWRATVSYRSEINYEESLLESAGSALENLQSHVRKWLGSSADAGSGKGEVSEKHRDKFVAALEDDFNTPEAVAVLWEVVKDDDLAPEDKLATILDFDQVFGLRLGEITAVEQKISDEKRKEIEQLVKERGDARAKKDWDRADEIREKLEKMGVVVEDGEEGARWWIK